MYFDLCHFLGESNLFGNNFEWGLRSQCMLREGLGFFKFSFSFPDHPCFPRAGTGHQRPLLPLLFPRAWARRLFLALAALVSRAKNGPGGQVALTPWDQ